jgi:GGDEF domain-containing protein
MEIETMSHLCPDRDDDLCVLAPVAAPAPIKALDRPHGAVQAVSVAGPAQVAARVDVQLAQCRRRRSGLALLWVSVEAVSSDGHLVSTDVERKVRDEVVHRVCNGVRGTDRVLRESDRDVCILLPDATAAVAQRVARRFARSLNGVYRIDDRQIQVAVRIGCSSTPDDGTGAADLLRHAMERDSGVR